MGESGIRCGKCQYIARGGVSYTYVLIEIPHTKVTSAQLLLLLGRVLVLVRGTVWLKGGNGFGERARLISSKNMGMVLSNCRDGSKSHL